MRSLFSILTALPILLAVVATAEPIQKRTRFMMGTYVTIQAIGPRKATIAAIDAAMDRMEDVDRTYNSTAEGSPVYKFNHFGTPITDPEMIALIKAAQAVSRKSQGAFDITIFPLINLWNFNSDTPRVPAPDEIKDALQRVGHDKLEVSRDRVVATQDNVQIELGGIAKGLALQVAVEALKKRNVKSAIVDAGGDLYAYGTVDGGPWKVGIRNPRGEGIIAAISADDLTVVTSGDYERFFEVDGKRYHHLLDPTTGYPATGFASVTVFARSPVLADAWSTALFVLGPDKAQEAAEQIPQIEAIFVEPEGRVQVTTGLADGIEIIRNNPDKTGKNKQQGE